VKNAFRLKFAARAVAISAGIWIQAAHGTLVYENPTQVYGYAGGNAQNAMVRISPDGRFVGVCGTGGDSQTYRLLSIFDSETQERLANYQVGAGYFDFTPDSSRVVSAYRARGNFLGVRKVLEGNMEAIFQLPDSDSTIYAFALSPVGTTAAVSYNSRDDNVVRVIDWATGEVSQTLITGTLNSALRFSPDGTLLAGGDYQGTVRVWRVADGQAQLIQPLFSSTIHEVIFSPGAEKLAVGDSRNAKVVDLGTGETVLIDGGSGIDFLDDNTLIHSKLDDGRQDSLVVYDLEEGSITQELPNTPALPFGLPLGWPASDDRVLEFVDLSQTESIYSVTVSPGGGSAVVEFSNGLWSVDLTTGHWDSFVADRADGAFVSASLEPYGEVVVTAPVLGGRKGWVRVWESESAGLVDTIPITQRSHVVRDMSFASEGQLLVIAAETTIEVICLDGPITDPLGDLECPGGRITMSHIGVLWDMSSNSVIQDLHSSVYGPGRLTPYPESIAISQNGQRVVCGYSNGNFVVWDVGQYNPIINVPNGYRPGGGLAISADGVNAAVSLGPNLFIWDLERRAIVQEIVKPDNVTATNVNALEFSVEGDRLVVGTHFGLQVYQRNQAGGLYSEEWHKFAGTERIRPPGTANGALELLDDDAILFATGRGAQVLTPFQESPQHAVSIPFNSNVQRDRTGTSIYSGGFSAVCKFALDQSYQFSNISMGPRYISRYALATDGSLIAALERDDSSVPTVHRVTVWDVNAEAEVWSQEFPAYGVIGFDFSPDGQYISVLSSELETWHLKSGSSVGAVPVFGASMQYSPDGESIYIDNRALNAHGLPYLSTLPEIGTIQDLNETVAVVGSENGLFVLDRFSTEPVFQVEVPEGGASVVLSPGGTSLATTSQGGLHEYNLLNDEVFQYFPNQNGFDNYLRYIVYGAYAPSGIGLATITRQFSHFRTIDIRDRASNHIEKTIKTTMNTEWLEYRAPTSDIIAALAYYDYDDEVWKYGYSLFDVRYDRDPRSPQSISVGSTLASDVKGRHYRDYALPAATPTSGVVRVELTPVEGNSRWVLAAKRAGKPTLADSDYVSSGIRGGAPIIMDIPGAEAPSMNVLAYSASPLSDVRSRFRIDVTQTEAVGVTVELSPAEVAEGAGLWTIDGHRPMRSGVMLDDVSAGEHTLRFSHVPGFVAPSERTVTISAGSTNVLQGAYRRENEFGALQVIIGVIDPAENAGRWRVVSLDGQYKSSWLFSGDTEPLLEPGDYYIELLPLAGYPDQTPTPVNVVANNMTQRRLEYRNADVELGGLKIILDPPAVRALGAKWRINGGAWNDSGVELGDLTPGAAVIDFVYLSGWGTPEPASVTVPEGRTDTLTFTYGCPSMEAPQVTASDGTYADFVRIEWYQVEHISYRVLRGPESGTLQEAEPITDWITESSYDDSSAMAPTITSSGGAQCQGPPERMTTLHRYRYWLESRITGCEESSYASDIGYRGAQEKIYAKALPVIQREDGLRAATSGSRLALRLRADDPLDLNTIWAEASAAGRLLDGVTWRLAIEGQPNDVWIEIDLDPGLEAGSVIRIVAEAETLAGESILAAEEFVIIDGSEPQDLSFVDEEEQEYTVIESDKLFDGLVTGGGAGELNPMEVYVSPRKFAIPVEGELASQSLRLLYFDPDTSSWHDADAVEGFLVPGSERLIWISNVAYLTFEALHGGVVRLDQATSNPESSIANSAANVAGEFAVFLLLLTILAGASRPGARKQPE
jgi:WD40 repeat protein